MNSIFRFNETQQFYLTKKKELYHTSDGEQTKLSLLNLSSFEEIIDLINYFWYNICVLMENEVLNTGYCGQKFFLSYKSDSNKIIDFTNYPITKENLKEIIKTVGSYLPILMFFDEDECLTAIECVHTQHSLRVIKEMFESNQLIDEKFLFIIKPNITQLQKPISFLLPLELYKKVGYLLGLDIQQQFNEKYILLQSTNILDLWLLFKLYHKEASYYISHTMKYMYDNNYYPPHFLNMRKEMNV